LGRFLGWVRLMLWFLDGLEFGFQIADEKRVYQE